MKRRYLKRDTDWADAVKKRDANRCIVCKKKPTPRALAAHHIIPFEFEKYKYTVDNGVSLCSSCHTFGKRSVHKNALWFTNWLWIHRRFQYFLAMQRIKELE